MIKDKTIVTCDRCKNEWILDPSDVSAWCQKNMVAIDDYGNTNTVGEITSNSTRYEICRNCYDKFKTFMGFNADESKVMISMPMPSGCIKCPALNEDGDYPTCILTGHSQGYSFNRSKRMPDCPMIAVTSPKLPATTIIKKSEDKSNV